MIKQPSDVHPGVLAQLSYRASRVHTLLEQWDDAIEQMNRALAQPSDGSADDGTARVYYLIDLGRLFRMAGRTEEAKHVFEDALNCISRRSEQAGWDEKIQEKDLGFEIGALCSERGEHLEAAETYRKLLGTLAESDPDYWTCLLYLAICEGALKRYEDARENLQAILASESPPPETRDSARQELFLTRYCLAGRDYEAKKSESSIFELESLLSEKIEDAQLRSGILLTLGHAYCFSKRYPEARKCYEDLISSVSAVQDRSNEAQEDLLNARYYLAACDYDTARYESSIKELESMLSEELDDDDLRSRSLLLLGHAYLASKLYPQSRRCYAKILSSGSATPDQRNAAKKCLLNVRYELAVRDYVEAKYEAAIHQLESLLSEELEDDVRIRSLMWLGHAYAYTKRYAQARKCYEDVANSASITQEQRDKAREFIGRLPEHVN